MIVRTVFEQAYPTEAANSNKSLGRALANYNELTTKYGAQFEARKAKLKRPPASLAKACAEAGVSLGNSTPVAGQVGRVAAVSSNTQTSDMKVTFDVAGIKLGSDMESARQLARNAMPTEARMKNLVLNDKLIGFAIICESTMSTCANRYLDTFTVIAPNQQVIYVDRNVAFVTPISSRPAFATAVAEMTAKYPGMEVSLRPGDPSSFSGQLILDRGGRHIENTPHADNCSAPQKFTEFVGTPVCGAAFGVQSYSSQGTRGIDERIGSFKMVLADNQAIFEWRQAATRQNKADAAQSRQKAGGLGL